MSNLQELSGLFDCHILSLFLISRFLWLYISLRRAQRAIVLDWFDKGEYASRPWHERGHMVLSTLNEHDSKGRY